MKRIMFITAIGLLIVGNTFAQSGGDRTEMLKNLLSPNVAADNIPKDLKFPDSIANYLTTEYFATVGKGGSFDVQFKIVLLGTKITNQSDKKYNFFESVAMSDIKQEKNENRVTAFSPDARVLAINTLANSSNSNYINSLLTVIERDQAIKPRIAAAKVLPVLGRNSIVVNKLVELLKNQYGDSRAKFKESDQNRFDEDKIAQAIVETLGDIGDPSAFPALMQVATATDKHTEDTVKAAWDSMKKLNW
jgi:hypothetical protein